VINAIKFSIEEIEASDQYFDHTGSFIAGSITRDAQVVTCSVSDRVYVMWFTEPEEIHVPTS
jgi:hypothetical protein